MRCLYVTLCFAILGGTNLDSKKRYAYFHDLPQADLPYVNVPLHTVIKLTPKAYGCDEERFVIYISEPLPSRSEGVFRYTLPIKAVDTHRPKPMSPAPTIQIKTEREYFMGGVGRAKEETGLVHKMLSLDL